MFNEYFIGAIVAVSMGAAFLYWQNGNLKEELFEQKVALAESIDAFNILKENSDKQAKLINELTEKNIKNESEVRRYLEIFKRHNLSKLAAAKPGLIEERANEATKQVFDSIESDSKFNGM